MCTLSFNKRIASSSKPMGCVSSKLSSKPSRWCSRHVSPTLSAPDEDDDDNDNYKSHHCHVVSLVSTSYGLLSMDNSPPTGSFLQFHNSYQLIAAADNGGTTSDTAVASSLATPNASLGTPNCSSTQTTSNEKQCLLMLEDEDGAKGSHIPMETINTWELMEGLEEYSRTPSPSRFNGRSSRRRSPKPASFGSFDVSDDSEMGLPVWKKYYMLPEIQKENTAAILPSGSPFADSPRKMASSSSSFLDSGDSRSSSSCGDRGNTGLKVLLSPAYSPSRFRHYLPKKGGLHATSFSFDGNTEQLRKFLGSFRSPYRSPDVKKKRSTSRRSSQDSQKESEGLLFDPSLIATFEQALDAAMIVDNQSDWIQSTSTEDSTTTLSTSANTSTSSASANTWTSYDTSSDAESRPEWCKKEKISSIETINGEKVQGMEEPLMSVPSFIEVKSNGKRAQLSTYDWKCPPRGEGKVVLYFTSLRGVRKTFEDCCSMRLILNGLGVHVDERDVSMHSKFKEELIDILGNVLKGPPYVPQLFIKGRYIGGADEVRHLHEGGVLTQLVDGIPLNTPLDVCDVCGDVRFIPCCTCNGSCKIYNIDGKVSKCCICNENGLIMCPMCTSSR